MKKRGKSSAAPALNSAGHASQASRLSGKGDDTPEDSLLSRGLQASPEYVGGGHEAHNPTSSPAQKWLY